MELVDVEVAFLDFLPTPDAANGGAFPEPRFPGVIGQTLSHGVAKARAK